MDPDSSATAPREPRLCLLSVHAHPDDESSKGAGTVHRYHSEGVHTVLVCCTGGEAGDILNPAMDKPEVKAKLAAIRADELRASADILGYARVCLLGYHDSGMPNTETNARPDNFANAPLDEAVGRLVKIIRAERPQVVVSYAEDRAFYGHPDHIRVFEITGPAFDAAGDPARYPEAGDPWQPSKVYYTGWTAKRIRALDAVYKERGEESPYQRWFERGLPDQDEDYTTYVDVGDFLDKRKAALLAHRTQVDPDGHWLRLPTEVIRQVFPWEEFALARSLVENRVPEGEKETDLFAGIRAPV
ncbi:MAG: mycothiol conjugate amidase Mca [Acidimicrobiales bacterium]